MKWFEKPLVTGQVRVRYIRKDFFSIKYEVDVIMNSLGLGGVLKRIYSQFNMGTFDDRIKLQKIVYLLQAKNINLGYNFEWYLYGPYSVGLTKDGFQIEDLQKSVEVEFSDKITEQNFNEFINFIRPHQEDVIWLEIASSIHLLKKMYPSQSKNQIIEDILNKRGELSKKRKDIEKIWQDIEGWLI